MKKTKNVKVAVDSFLTIRQTRGISSYISRLSVLIKKNTNKNISFVFIRPKIKKLKSGEKFKSIYLNFYLIIWEQFIFPIKAKLHNCDYVIYPSNTGSVYLTRFLNLKFILVLHDVYFTLNNNKYPQYFNISQFLSYIYRKILVRKLCRNAFKIITVSKFAEKMIIKYDKSTRNKIIVLKNFINIKKKILSKKVSKSILLVTGFHPQKNLQNILPFLFNRLVKFNIFIVGISKESISKIVNNNLIKKGFKNNKINVYSHLEKKKLYKVYSKTEIFLMPSIFESFSIPLLEACYFNNMIICSETGATKETTKNMAEYYSNKNLNNLKNKIDYLLKLSNKNKKKFLHHQSKMLKKNNKNLDNKNFNILLKSL